MAPVCSYFKIGNFIVGIALLTQHSNGSFDRGMVPHWTKLSANSFHWAYVAISKYANFDVDITHVAIHNQHKQLTAQSPLS